MNPTPAHATPHAAAPACARHCNRGAEPCPTPHMCGLTADRWPFRHVTDPQRIARIDFEVAARNGNLRGLPSVFGALA